MKGSLVIDVAIQPSVRSPGLSKLEIAEVLVKAYKDALAKLEADYLVKQRRMADLRKKIALLESTVTPTVGNSEVQQYVV